MFGSSTPTPDTGPDEDYTEGDTDGLFAYLEGDCDGASQYECESERVNMHAYIIASFKFVYSKHIIYKSYSTVFFQLDTYFE